MKRKILASLAALLMGLTGGAFLSASPAQAWSYCENAGWTANRLNLYPFQGYCGSRMTLVPPSGTGLNCMRLDQQPVGSPGAAADFAGSAWNRTARHVKFYPISDCDGAPNLVIPPGYSHPNFAAVKNEYGYWLYHNTGSVLWYNG